MLLYLPRFLANKPVAVKLEHVLADGWVESKGSQEQDSTVPTVQNVTQGPPPTYTSYVLGELAG